MPRPNPKNYAIAPGGVAADLGLGDLVSQQVQDDTDERKKKLLKDKTPDPLGQSAYLSEAARVLFGPQGGGNG